MRIKPQVLRGLSQVLIVVCAMLVLLTLVQWPGESTPANPSGEMSLRQAQAPGPPPDGPTPADTESYAIISERPLFTATRRPPESGEAQSGAPVATQPAEANEQFKLYAVVIHDGERLALIQAGQNLPVQNLKLGESIQGWTLAEVVPEAVVLQKENETRRLELTVRPSDARRKPDAETGKRAAKTLPAVPTQPQPLPQQQQQPPPENPTPAATADD